MRCVVHTDRGSQFWSQRFGWSLQVDRIIGLLRLVGTAGDNAAMESFFSLIKKNVLNRQRWAARQQLREAVASWGRADLSPTTVAETTRRPDPDRV